MILFIINFECDVFYYGFFYFVIVDCLILIYSVIVLGYIMYIKYVFIDFYICYVKKLNK